MIALFLRTCRLELRPNTVLLKWPQNGDGNGSHARKAETRRKTRGVTHATNATPIDATQVMQRLRTDTRRIRNKRRDAKRRQATRRTRDGHATDTKQRRNATTPKTRTQRAPASMASLFLCRWLCSKPQGAQAWSSCTGFTSPHQPPDRPSKRRSETQ